MKDEWEWKIVPEARFIWAIYVSKGIRKRWPYTSFGSRERAIRKAQRIIKRRQKEDDRREDLTIRSQDYEG